MTFLNFDTYSNFFYQMKKPHLAKTVISFFKNLLTQGSNPKKKSVKIMRILSKQRRF